MINAEMLDTYLYWIFERENIRRKKDVSTPKPWSMDPIFQNYKFCNVEREQDKVTKWIKDNWREPYRGHPNMWFAMIVARLFNWPDTLEEMTFPQLAYTDYREKWRRNLKGIRDEANGKVFTGAYLVSTNGVKMDKIDYILDRVLMPIWLNGLAPDKDDTLQSYWEFLTQFDGLGSFMAGQVVADLKYVDPILEKASDWWSWAPLGPGSTRGLNRLHNRPLEKSLNQKQGLVELQELQSIVKDKLKMELPVHDIQNCCCEFYKYVKIKFGEGRTRSSYPGVF